MDYNPFKYDLKGSISISIGIASCQDRRFPPSKALQDLWDLQKHFELILTEPEDRCPVRALIDWRKALGCWMGGPIFRRISKSGGIQSEAIGPRYWNRLIRQ